jgi:site-specific DNA recombinase
MTSNGSALIPAAAYVRMSTDRQEDSPERQRRDINELAERDGYEIIKWYEDHGKTGTESRKRTDFQKLLKDAKGGTFKAVLLTESSRLSREDPFTVIDHWRVFRDAGVDLVNPRGKLDLDDIGGFITAYVHQYGAHQESHNIARRVVSGMRLALSKGRHPVPPCFGYDREVRDEEGEVVRRIPLGERFRCPKDWTVALVLSDDLQAVKAVRYAFDAIERGKSCAEIVRWLRGQGILTRAGLLFNEISLKYLLTNPVYVGTLRLGYHARGQFNHVVEGIVTTKNAHPAIITQEQFDRVQEILKVRARTCIRRDTPGRYLLGGLVFCGYCGHRLTAGYWTRAGRSGSDYNCVNSYRCKGKQKYHGQAPCVRALCVRASDLEKAVVAAVLERVLSPENEARIQAEAAAAEPPRADPSPEQRRLGELREEIVRAEKNLALADTDADYAAIRRVLAELREEAERLRARIRGAAGENLPAPAQAVLARLAWLRENLSVLGRQELAECLRQLIRRVEVRRESFGEYRGHEMAGTSALVHFAPEWLPRPVPLIDVSDHRRDELRAIVDFIREAGPMHYTELVRALEIDSSSQRLPRLLARAKGMGLLCKEPGQRGRWFAPQKDQESEAS